MEMLTEKQIEGLHKHDYVSEGCSICEPALQVVWNYIFKLVPPTWAATSLTVAGLVFNVIATCIMIYYNPGGTEEVPSWVYLNCAFGVFAYLTFDALDGKQGRRTRDGPVEELFDHGADSLSTVCIVLCVCFSLKLGQDVTSLLFLVCISQLSCYMSIWQKYASGVMKFGRIDVVEGNLAVVFIHILCAISPTGFDSTVPWFNVTLRYLCVTSNAVLSIPFVLKQFIDISKRPIQTKTSQTKRPDTAVPVIPIGLAISLQVTIAFMTTVYTHHPCLYLITFGVVVSKLTLNLIVADITKDEVPIFDRIILGPVALLVNHYLGSIFSDKVLLLVVCIYSAENWLRYFFTATAEICHHLNIYCFNVTSRPYSKSRMPTA